MQITGSLDPGKLPYLLAYVFIFLLAGAAWSVGLFGRKHPFWRGAGWLALLLGALGLVVTLRVQPPLQQALGRWAQGNQVSIYVYGFGLTLISGVVQELLKLVAMLVPRRLFAGNQPWFSVGIAAGLGFGVWEACQIVAWPLSVNGIISSVAVLERVFAIAYHIATPVIMAYGLQKGRLTPYLVFAILSHGIINYVALLYHQWVIDVAMTEILLTGFSVAMIAFAYILCRRVSYEKV